MRCQEAGGIAAGGHVQPAAYFFGMGLDRAFADIQSARNFLGLVVLVNQPQDFLVALCQRLYARRSVLHPRSPARTFTEPFIA